MLDTMIIGDMNKIYIIYVDFDMKENQNQANRLKCIRELVAANDIWHPAKQATRLPPYMQYRNF